MTLEEKAKQRAKEIYSGEDNTSSALQGAVEKGYLAGAKEVEGENKLLPNENEDYFFVYGSGHSEYNNANNNEWLSMLRKCLEMKEQGIDVIQQLEHLREERNYFQETCEDIELNYYCDHKGVCKAQELEKEKCELLGIIQEKDKAIKKLIADMAGLEKDLEAEKKINEQIKVRFVRCNTCTEEMKSKCLMFSENLCEGERCEELVDLMSLINKE